MRRYAVILLPLLFSTHALAAGPLDTVAAFHAALSNGDKGAAAQLLSPDVLIFESGFVERSRDEYARHHLDGDIAFSSKATRKVVRQGEKIDGKYAFVWQETETTASSKGKPAHLFGTETAVLEKNGEQWSIVHVHWSSRKMK